MRKFTGVSKKRETPLKCPMILLEISLPDLAYQKILVKRFQAQIYKNMEFLILYFFPRREVTHACLIVSVFLRRDHNERIGLEDLNRAHLNGNQAF